MPQHVGHACAWEVVHIYPVLTGYAAGNRDEAAHAARQYTQSAGWVAVHPVVFHLMAQYPCIVNTLRARVFTSFNYDPTNYFAPEAVPDNCGFVLVP